MSITREEPLFEHVQLPRRRAWVVLATVSSVIVTMLAVWHARCGPMAAATAPRVRAAPPSARLRSSTVSPLSSTLRLLLQTDDGAVVTAASVCFTDARGCAAGTAQAGLDADGALRCRWPPGHYRVEVTPMPILETLGYWPSWTREVELVAGRETTLTEHVTAGGRLRVQLTTPSGREVESIEGLRILAQRRFPESAQSCDMVMRVQGRCALTMSLDGAPAGKRLRWLVLLPPGRQLLTIRSHDFAEATVPATIIAGAITDVQVALAVRAH